jgi:MOSC domain-containing protein YiiM
MLPMDEWPPAISVRLLIGRAIPFGPNGEPSAIGKQCATGPLHLSVSGLLGDEQGDHLHHGGPDKALHHYPGEHYAVWRHELPRVAADRFSTGGFGENLATVGLTEQNVCVGDIFRLGTALIQVSQARQPCWKLNIRFGVPDMAKRVQESARTGWYYRVLGSGEVLPGSGIRLIDRPHRDWPLARLLHYLYVDPLNTAALKDIAALSVLPPSWRRLAVQRLVSGLIEDGSRRMKTPMGGSE